jgi:hypothetical protein
MFSTVVPLQARRGPEGSRRFRLPDFHDVRHVKVVRSSASRTGRLYPEECSWYSFSLGAESNLGPWYGRKEICHWKIQWHHRDGYSVAKKYKNKHPRPEGTGGAKKYRDELLYSWHFESRALLAQAGSQNRCRYSGDEEGNSKIHPCHELNPGHTALRA